MVDNGRTKLDEPAILANADAMQSVASELRKAMSANMNQNDLSKYLVMDGMQDFEKVSFFTEFKDFDDVLRMNTIQMFVKLAPTMVKRTSEKSAKRINGLLFDVYSNHVETHKVNMTSLNRKREKAYVDILRMDGGEGTNNSVASRFFGGGKQK